ncbi:hypothetical protein D1872_206050 [compost metagenome]
MRLDQADNMILKPVLDLIKRGFIFGSSLFSKLRFLPFGKYALWSVMCRGIPVIKQLQITITNELILGEPESSKSMLYIGNVENIPEIIPFVIIV